MTYQQTLALLTSDQQRTLNRLVEEKAVSEAQIKRILNDTLGINDRGNYSKQVTASQLILVFNLLNFFKTKAHDLTGYENTIKRLITDNAVNTANEITTHGFLKWFFKNYEICKPLFGYNADGILNTNKSSIQVEIKTRFPEKYEILYSFCSLISSVFRDDRFECHFIIDIEAAKAITWKSKDAEIASLKIWLESVFKHVSLAAVAQHLRENLDQNFSIEDSRKSNGFEYKFSLHLFLAPTDPFPVLGLPEQTGEETFYERRQGRFMGTRTTEISYLLCTASKALRQDLAAAIVTQCIRTAKNLPAEPRMLAIYSQHAGPECPFIQRVVDDYLRSHTLTVVIILETVCLPEQASYSLKYLGVGTELRQEIADSIAMPGPDSTRQIADVKAKYLSA